jgi:hypothetical protein
MMQSKFIHREDMVGPDFVSQLILLGGGTFIVLVLVFVLLTAMARAAISP